jgi:hypothetical protein
VRDMGTTREEQKDPAVLATAQRQRGGTGFSSGFSYSFIFIFQTGLNSPGWSGTLGLPASASVLGLQL